MARDPIERNADGRHRVWMGRASDGRRVSWANHPNGQRRVADTIDEALSDSMDTDTHKPCVIIWEGNARG